MAVTIEKYKDEVSGKLFDKIEDAEASETRNAEIRDAFSFYDPVEDKTGDFANGKLCVQPRPDINMTWYAVSLVSLGILGIISMHFAFEEDKQ